MRSVLLFVAITLATSAAAQELGDDFEDGGWSSFWKSVQGSVSVIPAAFHRGTYGMRLNVVGASYAQAALSDGDGGQAALRFWLHPIIGANGMEPLGDIYVSTGISSPAVAEVVGGFDGGVPFIELGWSTPAGPQFAGNPTYLKTNSWYLVETAVRGVGSSFTVAGLWKDGSQIAMSNQQDTTGLSLSQITVGAPIVYKSDPLTETFDFDDVRETNFGLPGSTLVTQAPTDALVGACTPMTLALQTSTNGPASAPYTFTAGIADVAGSTAFFLDAACSQFTLNATFSVGMSSVPLFFESCSSTAYPIATALDFRATGAVINIDTSLPDGGASVDGGSDAGSGSPDGGASPDAGSSEDGGAIDAGRDGGTLTRDAGSLDGGAPSAPRAELGCGCDHAGAGTVALVLLATLALRQRSSRSRRSRRPQSGHA